MTERLHFHFSLSCIGEGNGNPLQCSCLENPRDGGAWRAAVYGVLQGQTRLKQLGSSRDLRLYHRNCCIINRHQREQEIMNDWKRNQETSPIGKWHLKTQKIVNPQKMPQKRPEFLARLSRILPYAKTAYKDWEWRIFFKYILLRKKKKNSKDI